MMKCEYCNSRSFKIERSPSGFNYSGFNYYNKKITYNNNNFFISCTLCCNVVHMPPSYIHEKQREKYLELYLEKNK